MAFEHTARESFREQRFLDLWEREAWAIAPFWDNVDVGAESECWEWTGVILPTGYGSYCPGSRGFSRGLAHREAYRLRFGECAKGLHILHSCDNRPCCNPYHLRAGTCAENMADRNERHPRFRASRLLRWATGGRSLGNITYASRLEWLRSYRRRQPNRGRPGCEQWRSFPFVPWGDFAKLCAIPDQEASHETDA